MPTITAGVTSGSVSSLTIAYGSGYDSDSTGFTNAPEIIISPSDGGGTSATATVSLGTGLNAGKITGYTIPESGTSYTNTPDVQLVGGPHFVRIIDDESDYYGRVFLITNNSLTTLQLDVDSAAVSGETASASTFFSAGVLVEVVPAATLSSVFGLENSLVNGWDSSSGYDNPQTGDSIFLRTQGAGYEEFTHCDFSSHRFLNTGWYSTSTGRLSNNTVIYPDEAIIIAKRISGSTTFDIDISDSDAPAKLYLPTKGSLFVANNPYGMKMLLAELIPSTSIGSNNDQFNQVPVMIQRIDLLTILGDAGWTTYYYKTGDNDGGITEMMQASARSGSGGSNALIATDLFIDSGTVTNIQSCSDAAGSNIVTNYNDGDYSKISITGSSQSNITGFKVSLADLQGYMLSDDGLNEVNATSGESVDTNGTGSVVYSNLNGSHTIVGSGSGFIVIEKRRDVNFKSVKGSPVWMLAI